MSGRAGVIFLFVCFPYLETRKRKNQSPTHTQGGMECSENVLSTTETKPTRNAEREKERKKTVVTAKLSREDTKRK
jgi:hypothetical protein